MRLQRRPKRADGCGEKEEKQQRLNCTPYNLISDHSHPNQSTNKNGFGLFAEKKPNFLLLPSSRQEYFPLSYYLYYGKLSCRLGICLNRVR